jgi:hypothetical protein
MSYLGTMKTNLGSLLSLLFQILAEVSHGAVMPNRTALQTCARLAGMGQSIRLKRFRPLLAPSHVAPSHEVAVLVQTERHLVRR